MSAYTLVIGNKRYSSWSLRGWLAVKMAEVDFDEVLIPLRQENSRQNILVHSPSGKVPLLKTSDGPIWDSLAIGEFLAEVALEKDLWPRDPEARALARSVTAEMHSGFAPLRANMPMDLKDRFPGEGLTPEVQQDIDRICEIWRHCRSRFGADGPFLFGKASLADAAYAPVVTRFVTFDVDLDDICKAYRDTVMAWPLMKEWTAAALEEEDVIVGLRP
ncbi:MAG: glutathione S-transferase family protein [Pseudomonadota bacterium]